MMSHRLNLYKVGYLKILLKLFGKTSIIVPEEVRKQSNVFRMEFIIVLLEPKYLVPQYLLYFLAPA